MDKPSCDLAVALRIITMQSFYGATVAGLTAVGSGFGTTAGADRRRDVSISSTIQIILYMWDDHVSFGNKNPASGYKLQIFDKGQIMKGTSCPFMKSKSSEISFVFSSESSGIGWVTLASSLTG